MELTTKELVILDLDCTSKDTVIQTLAQKMAEVGVVENYDEFLASLMERENIAPTSVGYEIGLPHGKSSTVKKGAIAFASLKKPIIWDLENNEKVERIFMLAIPESEKGSTHVELLVNLSRKILDNNFRDSLKRAKIATEVVELINR